MVTDHSTVAPNLGWQLNKLVKDTFPHSNSVDTYTACDKVLHVS